MDTVINGNSIGRGDQGFQTRGMSKAHARLGVSCYGRGVGAICRRLFSRTLRECGTGRVESSQGVGSCCRGVQDSGRRGPFRRVVLRINNGKGVGTSARGKRLTGRVLSRCCRNFRRQGPRLQIFSTRLRVSRTAPRLRVSFMPFAANDGHKLSAEISLGRTLTARNFGNNDHNSAR